MNQMEYKVTIRFGLIYIHNNMIVNFFAGTSLYLYTRKGNHRTDTKIK